MTHAEKITRREFGRIAALALPLIAAAQGPNVFEVLSKYRFTRKNGNDAVNIASLKQELANSFVTVNTGLDNCTSTYCVKNDKSLHAIHRLASPMTNLTHIIIDVDPQVDGKTPKSREDYLNMLSAMTGLQPKNLIVLYPADISQIPTISNQLKLTTGYDDPKSHSAEIGLFAPGGNFLDKKNSRPWDKDKVDQFDDWKQYLGRTR